MSEKKMTEHPLHPPLNTYKPGEEVQADLSPTHWNEAWVSATVIKLQTGSRGRPMLVVELQKTGGLFRTIIPAKVRRKPVETDQ